MALTINFAVYCSAAATANHANRVRIGCLFMSAISLNSFLHMIGTAGAVGCIALIPE